MLRQKCALTSELKAMKFHNLSKIVDHLQSRKE